jgi:hypothetical protein
MDKMYKINGNPEEFADLDVFHKLSQQFLPFAQKRMQFDKPVGINLISDPQNAKNPLGKTAYYNPGTMEVTVFVDNRHVKDILRSMSHELVHHTQNCRGEFEGGVHTGPGYAQEDGHMRKMEEEAYLEGQMTLRDFEDNLKKENKVMAEVENKKKADLNKDGKLSSYEKKRGAAIEKAMKDTTISEEAEVVNTLDPDYEGPDFDFDAAVQAAKDEFNNKLRKVMKKEGFSEDEIASITGQMASPGLGTTTDPPSAAQQAVDDLFSGAEEEYAAAMGEPGRAMARGTGRPAPMQEGEGGLCEDCGKNHGPSESHCPGKKDDSIKGESHCPGKKDDSIKEGWSNKKDQLLFERLVSKWIK